MKSNLNLNFIQEILTSFSKKIIRSPLFSSERRGQDGRRRPPVLHGGVEEVPVFLQGARRGLRLPEPSLGQVGVRRRGGVRLRGVPAGPRHVEGPPVQVDEQGRHQRRPFAH